jgi:hypothetical protein
MIEKRRRMMEDWADFMFGEKIIRPTSLLRGGQ